MASKAAEDDGLVHMVAKRFRGVCRNGLDYDDLVQAGRMGVIVARGKYDPAKAQWSTYAVYWIRSAIENAILRGRSTVRTPAYKDRAVIREYGEDDDRGGASGTEEALSAAQLLSRLDWLAENSGLTWVQLQRYKAMRRTGETSWRAFEQALLKAVTKMAAQCVRMGLVTRAERDAARKDRGPGMLRLIHRAIQGPFERAKKRFDGRP